MQLVLVPPKNVLGAYRVNMLNTDMGAYKL